jgi:hypothetical protein
VVNIGLQAANNVVITDALPLNAHYVSGGTLLSDSVVRWTIPSLAANGGQVTVSFVVTTTGALVNAKYGASCANCIPAVGQAAVVTNGINTYLPLLFK